MKGWQGKVLWVNLSERTLGSKPLDPQVAKDYIGGRGLGTHYLNRSVDPQCDPFSAENMFIMATGPLTGTPTGSRYIGDDQVAFDRGNHLLQLRGHIPHRIQTHRLRCHHLYRAIRDAGLPVP